MCQKGKKRMDERQWIEQAIREIDLSISYVHQSVHSFFGRSAVPHNKCIVGTCGSLNTLIRRAEHAGYRPDGVPSRL